MVTCVIGIPKGRHMLKLQRLISIFTLVLGLMTGPLLRAQEVIPHAVGLYLTDHGQSYISENIEEIFFRNGLSIESAYFPEIVVETEEQTLEEMLGNQDDLRELVQMIKEHARRFFTGLDLDKHRFQVDLNEIEFYADWSDVRINFVQPIFSELEEATPALSFSVYVEASRVQLNVKKIDFQDLNHPFLGQYGLDYAELILDENVSQPLYVELMGHVFKREDGRIEIKVEAPQTNLSQVQFQSNFRSPIRMPVIEVRINDHVVRINQPEVEALFREKQADIFSMAQEELQNWLNEDGVKMLNDLLAEKLQGDLIEVNQMDPPGAPEGQLVPKFEWGLSLGDINFVGDMVHVGLDGFVRDPMAKTTERLASRLVSRELPSLRGHEKSNHDMLMTLNQGFINKIIQLSADRQYFSKVDLDNGESIPITKNPELILNGSSRPHLALEIEYEVTGLQALFVKNPIRISFNMIVDFAIGANGKTQLVGRGVDMNSVNLPDRYIRMFASKVRSAVTEKIEEMQGNLNGMVIVDEFPIPSTLFGIDLNVTNASIDRAGHMLIHIDFKRSGN